MQTRSFALLLMVFFLSYCSLLGQEEQKNEFQANSHPKTAQYYLDSGIELYNTKKYKEAIFLYKKSYQAYILIYDTIQQIHALRNIGLCHIRMGNELKALENYQKALVLSEQNDHSDLIYRNSVSISNLFEKIRQPGKAKQLLNRLNQNKLIPSRKAQVSNLMGNIYFQEEKMDSAIYFFKTADYLYDSLKDPAKRAISLNNIGESYFRLDSLFMAEQYLSESLKIRSELNDVKQLSNFNNLAALRLQRGKLNEANQFLEKSKSMLDTLDDERERIKYLSIKKRYLVEKKLFKRVHQVDYLLDSLNDQNFKKERLAVSEMQAAYEAEKKDKEIALQVSNVKRQTLETQEARKMNIMLLMGIVLVVIVSFFLFRIYRKNKLLSEKNELLLKEQNHRVKNNLQMISSLMSLQSKKMESTQAKDALSESQSRIDSVSLLHRMLYKGEKLGSVNIVEYLSSLIEEIQYAVTREVQIDLNLPKAFDWNIDKATSLGLIVNELITNSIKHAKADSLNVTLNLEISKGQKILITYKDNGQGIDHENWANSASFGNQLIKIQSEQLRGSYQVSGKNGFHYELEVSI